jgi:RNA polymerase sigma-70 factor (ECF subfamily)
LLERMMAQTAGSGAAPMPRSAAHEGAGAGLGGGHTHTAGPGSRRGPQILAPRPGNSAADKRLRVLVDEQYDFIWRSLRRLGVPPTDVDDCAQQVFWVASRKLDEIRAGSERAFLFSTALRVASDARRTRTRRREVPEQGEGSEALDPAPDPEEIADKTRARALLDEVLDSMPMELRAPFVLFELEEMPTAEIAVVLDVPTGTVASRLRRAREEFQKIVARVKARGAFRGGVR